MRLEASSRVPLPGDFPNGQCNNVCFFLVMPNFHWKR